MITGHRRARLLLVGSALMLAVMACSLGTGDGDDEESRPTKPLVLVLAPVNGSVIAEGAQVALHAFAEEARTGVARIELRVDDVPVGAVEAADDEGERYLQGVVAWVATERRGHLITAEAFRPDGKTLGLADIVVQVVEPPGESVDSPLATDTPAGEPLVTAELAPGDPTPVPAEPTSAPQPAPTVGPPALEVPEGSPVARANIAALNLRQGPGTGYPPVGTLVLGDAVPIIGRSQDGSWWAVAYGSGIAWVFTQLTTVEGDASRVPLVAAP